MLGAVMIGVWPAFAARRASPRPLILSVYGSAAVTAVFAALLGWLLAETRNGSVLGLATADDIDPDLLAVHRRRRPAPHPAPPSRPGHRQAQRGDGRGHRAGQGPWPRQDR